MSEHKIMTGGMSRVGVCKYKIPNSSSEVFEKINNHNLKIKKDENKHY
jgi:hypothetical protein